MTNWLKNPYDREKKEELLYRYVWYVGRDRLLTNERTLGIIDDVIHHYFSFWKEDEKYGKKPELQTKQNYKDYEALMQRERLKCRISHSQKETNSI